MEPPSLTPGYPSMPAGEPISMLQSNGQMWTVPDLGTLQRWILELRVSRTDLVSQHGLRWQRIGDRADLELFFLAADRMEGGHPAMERVAAVEAPVRPLARQFSTLVPPDFDAETVVVDAETTASYDSGTYDENVRDNDTQERTQTATPLRPEVTERLPSRRPIAPPPPPIDPLYGDGLQFPTSSPYPAAREEGPDIFDEPPPPRGGSGRWLLLAGGAVVLMLGLGVWFEFTKAPDDGVEPPPVAAAVVPGAVPATAEPGALVPAAVTGAAAGVPVVASADPLAPTAAEPPPKKVAAPAKKVDAPQPKKDAASPGGSAGGGSAKSLVASGWKSIEAQDYQKAHGLFSRALQKNGALSDALYGRGYASEKLGDTVSAGSDYCDALGAGANTEISREISAGLKRVGRSCS